MYDRQIGQICRVTDSTPCLSFLSSKGYTGLVLIVR